MTGEPSALSDLPWLLSSVPNAFRFGFTAWPFPGLPCFVVCVEGIVVIKLIQVSVLIEVGVEPSLANFRTVASTSEAATRLCGGDMLEAAVLKSGEQLWVPAGWVPVPVSVEECARVVAQPCLTKSHLAGLSVEARKFLNQGASSFFEKKGFSRALGEFVHTHERGLGHHAGRSAPCGRVQEVTCMAEQVC
jgi:hypothetical protein